MKTSNKNKILSLFIVIIISVQFSQAQKNDIPRKGFIVGSTTLQYGVSTSKKVSNTWYVTMRGEGYIEDNISIAGNIDISLPKKFKHNDILENYTLLFGANYHLIKKHFDGFIGFQPGVSFSKTSVIDYNLQDKNKYVWSPIMSSTIGARYYVGWIAHIYTSVSYLYGIQLSNQTNLPMSEFRIAVGLGINFNVLKVKS